MKKLISIVSIFLAIQLTVLAQSFNISMGVNLSSQNRSKQLSSKVGPMLGFNSEFSRDFHVWKNVFLRAEFAFEQSGVKFLEPTYIQVLSYSQLGTYLMYKTIHSPVYMGIGGFGDYLMSVSSFDGESSVMLDRKYYSFYDYGLEPILGVSLNFDFIRYFVEMRFHYGMNNIYRLSPDYIKNFGINLDMGISLKIH